MKFDKIVYSPGDALKSEWLNEIQSVLENCVDKNEVEELIDAKLSGEIGETYTGEVEVE